MSAPHRARLIAVLAAVPLILVGLASPGSSSAVSHATMSLSPKQFTGGQMVTYSGSVGVSGVLVKLQGSQRPGAPWSTIARVRSGTNGSYDISEPAPAMRGIRRRVVAEGVASNAVRMYAQSQDLVLVPVGTPAAGHEFEILVSTVPGPYWGRGHEFFVMGRPDLPAPVFAGRELTLQQRGPNGTWQDVPGGTATTDRNGLGSFTVNVADAGTVVYRVRQEDYAQAGGPDIGWFPSFPTPITIAENLATATTFEPPATEPARAPGSARTVVEADGPLAARKAGGSGHGFNATTAQARFGWGGALWDFGLPSGESLTSPPSRGSQPKGWWLDGSNGTGRANQHNGGVALNSQRYAPDKGEAENRGDRGSTWVTLQDNARRYGRWEARVRLRAFEKGARDYRGKVELIPSRSGQYRCGGQNIVVADLAAHARKMRIGVSSVRAKRKWHATRRVGDINNHPVAVAVEVTNRHITWFLNGRPVGTVGRAAVPRVPLTMRITMAGKGNHEMNRTMTHLDWMRGFSLKRGPKPTKGGRLHASKFRGGC